MSPMLAESLLIRRATVAPGSIHADQRTAEVIWSTGARVLRGFFERFYEELSLDPKHVRLERLTSGNAPLLAAHDGGQLDAVIGVVESARLEGGHGIARVRFAKDDPAADAAWNKVEQGILRNVSIGYKVHQYEKRAAGDEQVPVMRAVDWEPYEISVVPMGADAGATFRAATFPFHEEITMEPTTTDTTTPNPVDLERERTAGILSAVRAARLDMTLAERMIADGTALDAARAAVLARLIARQGAAGGPDEGPSGITVVAPTEEFRHAAADALCLRAGVRVDKPHAAAGDIEASVHAIARTCLSRAGQTHRGSTEALLTRAMTTSDFPLILVDAINKSVRRGYEDEPSSHRAWVRAVSVRDFKTQNRPILGSAPSLEEVLEHGEYHEASMTEDAASYVVEKFGRIVALTWEALLNDDLDAFLRIQPALGQAARRKEADSVYALFALNAAAGPTMQDGIALFHTSHANLGTVGSFDATLLGAARTLLRKQTALGGGQLALAPRFLIVPAEREHQAELLMAAASRTITSAATDTVPSWIGDLRLVVEPRLANGAVYLAASPEQIDTVELGLLQENMGGPTLTQDTEFVRDITRFKARHVFGVKALDWRGLVKQPVN
jgi:HK97 family phage prohead protease